MAYILRSDAETFLNNTLTNPQGQLLVDALIPPVEAYAQSYCNRTWSSNTNPLTFTETFDGGTDTFFPSNIPVTEVVSVTVDGSTQNLADVYNYGSYIRLATSTWISDGWGRASLYRGYAPQAVSITYKASVKIPDDLKHALVRWVAEIFKSAEDAGKTTERVSMGAVSVDFLTQDGIPKYVELVLNRYRLAPV